MVKMNIVSQDLFFSLIVVAKNAARTIDRCIDSIISQDFSNFELIVVIDSYSDTTLPVAEEIARKDSRVRVIVRDVDAATCQVGNARNCGIANALGKWIWFVDADDWISVNSLGRIADLLSLNNVDFLVCNVAYAYKDLGTIKITDPFRLDKKYADRIVDSREMRENKAELFDSEILGQSFLPCWRAVSSKKFLVENKISFQEDVVHEDNIFAMAAWLLARHVYIDSALSYFHYMGVDRGSTTRHATAQQIIDVARNCFIFLEGLEGDQAFSDMINKTKLNVRLQRYHYAKNLKMEQRRKYLQLLDKEIDEDIENLLDRYGSNGDVAFFDAVQCGEPERYQIFLALDDTLQTLKVTIDHIDSNVNRHIMTLCEVDDNVNRAIKTISYIDNNVNTLSDRLNIVENRLSSVNNTSGRGDTATVLLKNAVKSIERCVRRSLAKWFA
jgi:glycosyltransferase involved in cell wall biosynthesis